MKHTSIEDQYDIALVWAGIMSATLAALLYELDPKLKIGIFERLEQVALESSDAWNNAGTWHSAFCELNYTPPNPDWSIEISKALSIAEQFEISKQFWSTLVERWYITDPSSFINQVPHCSLVTNEESVAYLYNRYQALSKNHLFQDMRYTQDPETLKKRFPLIMDGRKDNSPIAATHVSIGTDVNFGSLTRQIISYLQKHNHIQLYLGHDILDIKKNKDNRTLDIKDSNADCYRSINAKWVFIGGGGGSLPLFQWTKVAQRKKYGWFPVSGQRLVCNNQDVIKKHDAKVYGRAEMDATPMSVPHLDTRIIDGKKALLFGPYAGFTTRFLKKGSFLDLFRSVRWYNIKGMLKSSKLNFSLIKYLIKEITQTKYDRIRSLQKFVPTAKYEDRDIQEAWYRVQIIKTNKKDIGKLQFGTEVVVSEDRSLATLLGASPWASTSVSIMLNLIKKCFPEYLEGDHINQIIPSYHHSLITDKEKTLQVRKWTHSVLGIKNDL